MAHFWEGLKRHEDTIQKHEITNEEIQFLKNMQHEMNTQDTVHQANPRYWVIRNYTKIYGKSLSNPDGISIFDPDACDTIIEASYDSFKTDNMIETILDALKDDEYELTEEEIESIRTAYDIQSLCFELEQIETYSLVIMEYQEIPNDEGVFFTHEAAIKHLKDNHYHYADKAHTYAKTAWRSSEEKLWDILQQVDFDALAEPVVYGEWIEMDDDIDVWYQCSVCRHDSTSANNFCSHCGADMRKKVE